MTVLVSTATNFDELLSWLEEEQNRRLLVLEENEVAIQHPRMQKLNPQDDEALKRAAWQHVFLPFEFREPDSEKARQALAKMAFFKDGVHLVASDFQDRGIDKLRNFFCNFPRLGNAHLAQGLYGAFSSIPAIICGAGHSLEREALSLRNLEEKALIFAGGTALSVLSKLHISPHFAGMIDPHPPEKRFFENKILNIPTLFQTRAHPELLGRMEGPLLWSPGAENDLFDNEYFDGGWNVSTFLTALACHFGCNPIILVGVDLSQTKEKAYAGDLERTEEGDLIHVEGDLYTRKDWLMAADWLKEFAKKHKEVEWITASKGLSIEGYAKKSLSALNLNAQEDLKAKIHVAIQSARKGANTVSSLELRKSLQRMGKFAQSMLGLLDKIFPNSPKKNGDYFLLKLEIEKELSYERFLKPIWDVWKYVFAREIPGGVPKEYGIELNQWLFMKGICDEAREI